MSVRPGAGNVVASVVLLLMAAGASVSHGFQATAQSTATAPPPAEPCDDAERLAPLWQVLESDDRLVPTSIEEAESLLVGTWIRCAGPPFPRALVDDVGVEVTEDGRYFRLFETDTGELARATGLEQEGEWDIVDFPGAVNFWPSGSLGLADTALTFFPTAPELRLDVEASGASLYRRLDGAAPISGLPPAAPGDCPAVADPIEPASIDDFEDLIVGVWIRCATNGRFVFDFPRAPEGVPWEVIPWVIDDTDDAGIEITRDGRFFRIYRQPDGTLVRAGGLDQEGTWAVVDQQEERIPSIWLETRLLGDRPVGGNIPWFFESPTPSLRLFGWGIADYQRWSGAPPVPGVPPGPEPACGWFSDLIVPNSIDEARELLVGTWQLCTGSSVVGTAVDDVAGLEIADDGRFAVLVYEADGSVARASGDGVEGTWTTPRLEEDVTIVGVTFRGRPQSDWLQPAFFASPTSVRITASQEGWPAFVGNYVRVDWQLPEAPATTTTTTTSTTTPTTEAPRSLPATTTAPATLPASGGSASTASLIAAATALLGAALLAISRRSAR